jgi:hypothetical protein
MKKLIYLLFLPLILSCGGNSSKNSESGNILENLNFTVDTVVVDPGDKLINLQFALLKSDLSVEKKYLYHLHPSDQVLSVINLDELKIERQIQFEKEGPNGIPDFAISIEYLEGNKFLFLGMENTGIFNLEAEMVKSLHRDSVKLEGITTENYYSYFYQLKADPKHNLLFSIPSNIESSKYSLAVFGIDSMKGKVIELPEFGFLSNFELIFREGKSYSSANAASVLLSTFQDQVLVHSQGTSSIYEYDILRNSLVFKTYDHKLVPNQKIPPASRESKSKQEFDEAVNYTRDQISFGGFVWDESRDLYFRFGSIRKPLPSPEATAKNEVFLFAYDKDLNLVGEVEMEDLDFQPGWPFFKDGKLWSYVNVEDELGFAVMEFKF